MNIQNKNNIAIVHDSLTHLGGAENVLFNLIEIFPNADIYTSIINKKYLKKLNNISKGKVYFSKLSNIKLARNNPDFFKPYILHYWQKLNLDKYDLVISSSHSFSSNWVNVKGKHISYIYTPPRYLYREFNEMYFLKRFPLKQIFFLYFNIIRHIDFKKIQKIDLLIAISKNVQNRILKYYKRKAIVIYPPVTLRKKTYSNNKRNYYLFFSRLVKQKGAELAIKAFNENGKDLLVVGEGKEKGKLKKIAKSNIKYLGFQSENKLDKIFTKVKALIYCSIDEDFGIIPVEAMSNGVPVIAYNSGGVKETIINNKTGIFFNKYNPDNLNKSIKIFESKILNYEDCIKQANKFRKEIFSREIQKQVKNLLP